MKYSVIPEPGKQSEHVVLIDASSPVRESMGRSMGKRKEEKSDNNLLAG
jgi:hypothetical protein